MARIAVEVEGTVASVEVDGVKYVAAAVEELPPVAPVSVEEPTPVVDAVQAAPEEVSPAEAVETAVTEGGNGGGEAGGADATEPTPAPAGEATAET